MATRRLKTYAAQTGYAYTYYFVGQRRALEHELPALEYIFDVSSDRKLTYAVSVFLLDAAVAAWAGAHGRPLRQDEQYAAAKLRLLRCLDEVEDVIGQGRRLHLDAAGLEELLSALGVD